MSELRDKIVVFRSKISIGLALFIVSIPLGLFFFFIYASMWLGVVLLLPVFILISDLYLRTFYAISKDRLRIRSGMFFDLTLDIDSVSQITKTGSVMSSPALSLDRLEVKYGKGSIVIISPSDRSRFIERMLESNPNIEVKV